jgi:hypothetical protein
MTLKGGSSCSVNQVLSREKSTLRLKSQRDSNEVNLKPVLAERHLLPPSGGENFNNITIESQKNKDLNIPGIANNII